MLCSQLGVHIRHKEELMGLFSIVCHRLAESDLHDSTKNTTTLFCRLTQNYFKDVCIPYRTAILLSYNIKQLVIYLAIYNHCSHYSVV